MEATLERAIERVVEGTRHWSSARWTCDGRATAMHALVQALADAGAAAEGEPGRDVPRLPNDQLLPDQLQVVGLDLLDVEERLTPDQRAEVEAAIIKARRALFPPGR